MTTTKRTPKTTTAATAKTATTTAKTPAKATKTPAKKTSKTPAKKASKSGTKTRQKYLSGHDWGRIMAHAWRDPDFRKRLEADPTATVRQYMADTWPDREYENIFHIHDAPADLETDQIHNVANGDAEMYHCSDLC